MASNQIELVYTAIPTNVTANALATAMGAVPLYTSAAADPLLGGVFGLTVESDVSAVASGNAVRTLILNMDFTAGAPFAPPFFPVYPQTVDGPAAIFSTSAQDGPGGIGALTVSISYADAEGNAGTITATLNGKTPVELVPALGTNSVATVTAMSVTSAGALNNNVGQLTVSQYDPPTAQELSDAADACGSSGQASDDNSSVRQVQSPQDFGQTSLGTAIAYIPPSFYSYTTAPGAAAPTPAQQIAFMTNLFTATLSLALAAPVVASTPSII